MKCSILIYSSCQQLVPNALGRPTTETKACYLGIVTYKILYSQAIRPSSAGGRYWRPSVEIPILKRRNPWRSMTVTPMECHPRLTNKKAINFVLGQTLSRIRVPSNSAARQRDCRREVYPRGASQPSPTRPYQTGFRSFLGPTLCPRWLVMDPSSYGGEVPRHHTGRSTKGERQTGGILHGRTGFSRTYADLTRALPVHKGVWSGLLMKWSWNFRWDTNRGWMRATVARATILYGSDK